MGGLLPKSLFQKEEFSCFSVDEMYLTLCFKE